MTWKVTVIVWGEGYRYAHRFARRPVPCDSHYLVVRINGAEVDYAPSCGLWWEDLPNGLPRDAVRISSDQANKMLGFG